MTAVKDIKVTEDFLGLSDNVKKCQSEETFKECSTRRYLHAVESQCNCIPYALKFSSVQNQVFSNPYSLLILILYNNSTKYQGICIQEGLACSDNIKINLDSCLPPCEGIFADVKNTTDDGSKYGFASKMADSVFIERYQKFKQFYEKAEGVSFLYTIKN